MHSSALDGKKRSTLVLDYNQDGRWPPDNWVHRFMFGNFEHFFQRHKLMAFSDLSSALPGLSQEKPLYY